MFGMKTKSVFKHEFTKYYIDYKLLCNYELFHTYLFFIYTNIFLSVCFSIYDY